MSIMKSGKTKPFMQKIKKRRVTKKSPIVVAIGGNSLTGSKAVVSRRLRRISKLLAEVSRGRPMIIVHGSGPQAGALMLSGQSSLDVIDAEVQGHMGYLIEQSVVNEFQRRSLVRPVITVVTQVVVDRNDESFNNPTKPVGLFYTKNQMMRIKKHGEVYIKSLKGYRRVVSSPKPLEIVEAKTISKLARSGVIVIAAGGGGIPVCRIRGQLSGVNGVVDKDYAAGLLAGQIGAYMLLIVTTVPYVYLNFGKKNQEKLQSINLKEARRYLQSGHFAAGSMEPKILAAIDFLEKGGRKVIITDERNASNALNGTSGTIIA
jgi:carbamate kinase